MPDNDELRNKYAALASQAGDLAYRIEIFEEELDKLFDQMRKLNQDFANANKPAQGETTVPTSVEGVPDATVEAK